MLAEQTHPTRRAHLSAARSAPWCSGTWGAASSRAPTTRTWTRSARCAWQSSSSGGQGVRWWLVGVRLGFFGSAWRLKGNQVCASRSSSSGGCVMCANGWVWCYWLGAAPRTAQTQLGLYRWLRGVLFSLLWPDLGACMHAESMLWRAPMSLQQLPAPGSRMGPNKQFLFQQLYAHLLGPCNPASRPRVFPFATCPQSRHGPTYGTVREGSRHLFEELARQGVWLALVDCREVLAQHAPAERSVVALEASSDAQVRWVALLRIMVLNFAVGITGRAGGMQAGWGALILGVCSSVGRRPARSAREGGTVSRVLMFSSLASRWPRCVRWLCFPPQPSSPCQAAANAVHAGPASHHRWQTMFARCSGQRLASGRHWCGRS